MKIGDVAKKLGITASRIRYYDSEGMIGHVPRNSGQRELGNSNVLGLELILLAQSAGFSMDEIKQFLAETSSDTPSPEVWRTLAETKKKDIHAQLVELKKMDRILSSLMKRMENCSCPTLTDCIRAYKAASR